MVDEVQKWLEWEEFLACIQVLRTECAPRDHLGQRRPQTAVAWSVQTYLIFR